MLVNSNNISDVFSAVFAARRQPSVERRPSTQFRIGDTAFSCHSHFPQYIARIENAVALHGAPTTRSCRIDVMKAGVDGMPALNWGEAYYREREVEAVLAKTGYRLHYFDQKDFWQLFDKTKSQGIQIMQGMDAAPDWDPGSPLRNFLHWQLSSPESGLVHAGTLGIDGQGVMLVGAGGSGKSGTVLAGVLNGMGSVGDDYVFAKMSPNGVEAGPVFRTLKQDESGLTRLGLRDAPFIGATPNWQNKFEFRLDDLGSSALVEQLAIGAILLPKIGHEQRCKISPISPKEVFLALAPSGVSQMHCDRAATFAFSAKLSRKLPCFELTLGPNPAEIAEVILKFIKGMGK